VSRSKVDTATEADWAFTLDSHIMQAVRWAAAKAARQFELVEFDDAYQDVLLYLAVRPELAARSQGTPVQELGQNLYAHALREVAVRESDWAARTEPLESPEDSE
jgi:hypothetical protein